MSAPFVIPFNFQPESVSVRTGSYTIPAGKYAFVTVNVEGTGTFTIGGTTALRGTSNTVLASSALDYRTGTGHNALITVSGGTSNDGNAFSTSTNSSSPTANYWLPSGTVINGSGTWRAVVSIFKNTPRTVIPGRKGNSIC